MNVEGVVESRLTEDGFLVVPEPDGGGFSCRLICCDDAECGCRSFHIRAVRFGPDVKEVLWGDQEATLVAKPGHGPVELSDQEFYDLVIDIDEGDLDWEAHVLDAGEKEHVSANPSLARLQQAFDGPVLEELGRNRLTIKGLEIKERLSQPVLDNWSPDQLVCWCQIFTEFRVDAYVVDEELYRALDYYCIDPGCECDEVSVDFDDVLADKEDSILGAVNVMLATGEVTLKPEPGWDEGLLPELWSRFIDRHGIDHLLQRQAKMKEFGSELAEAQSSKPGAARAGRNQPCPCGSGKKYKKCCLGKES